MLTTKINNHTEAALARLLQQYKGQPQLASLITGFVDQFQDLEDAIYSLDEGRQLAFAYGKQLDGIGELVGIQRNGLSDLEYLIFILGTIAENFSNTTLPTILNIANTIFEPAVLTLKEMFPAEVGIGIGGSATGLGPGQAIRGGEFSSGVSIVQVIQRSVSQMGHASNGSAILTNLDTTSLAPGMLVSGINFASIAAIQSIDSPTQVTMTDVTTSSTGDYLLKFSAVVSMSEAANVTSSGATFQTLDSFGNTDNTFTGDTLAGSKGITNVQVQLSDTLKLKIGTILQNSVGAGIALGFLTEFDAADSFAFDGTGPASEGAMGFGDATDPSVGGKFASLIYSSLPD